MLQTIHYTVDSVECASPCWIPPFVDEPIPALIVFPNLWGPNAYWDEMLEKFATLGFVTMIVDMYGKDTRPQTFEEAFEVIAPFKTDREAVRRRGLAALHALKKITQVNPDKIVALGYCFGGMSVLELARASAPILGVVSLHGNLGSPLPVSGEGTIEGSILALHGAEDPLIPDTEVSDFIAEMRTAKADWQLMYFGGQVHAFTDKTSNRPGHAVYDARTDRRSWNILVDFINEKFAE